MVLSTVSMRNDIKNIRYLISTGLIVFLSISIIVFKNDQNLEAKYFAFFVELNFIKIITLYSRPIWPERVNQ